MLVGWLIGERIMSDVEILEKAIKKAIKNGYSGITKDELNDSFININGTITTDLIWQTVVYSHDFAKALWGEKEFKIFDLVDLTDNGKTKTFKIKRYEYHLREMVISDNPIKYLEKHI